MKEERELIAAFGRAADGYDRNKVIGAAANLLMNALRQSHRTIGEAEEELDELVVRMKIALQRDHYLHDGNRNDRKVLLPPVGMLFPELAGETAKHLAKTLGQS